MSYDIWIGDCSFNYTSNVSALFYDHIPDEGKGGGLRELSDVTGRRGAEILSSAFDRISSTMIDLWTDVDVGEPKFCARYDSRNGWGSALGAIVFLAKLMAACGANPRKKVRVSL